MHELLTTAEMAEADRRATVLGIPSLTLMENAGRAVADEAEKMVPAGARIAVLCGPGNNGGDGFVAARLLRERGYDVRVACLVPVAELKGDAAEMAKMWGGEVAEDPSDWDWPWHQAALNIDALFGAGLSRPVDPDSYEAELIQRMNSGDGENMLAVDVPSGLNATTGLADGPSVYAERTVTFFRKKPGHLLLPGRSYCGQLIVADIGIPDDVLHDKETLRYLDIARKFEHGKIANAKPAASASSLWNGGHLPETSTQENHVGLWSGHLQRPRLDDHKYDRGHCVVVSGPADATGAARLAARGALRIGAGLVTVASPPDALAANAAHLTAIMLTPVASPGDFRNLVSDKRITSVLLGPAMGIGATTREMVDVALESSARIVLDADALTSFENNPDALFDRTRAAVLTTSLWQGCQIKTVRVVMTPHEGEFKRLFGDLPGSKLDRARAAAKRSGAIVILKGADTVIADPDGQAVINSNAPATLATAGSGDVLAGLTAGLLAQTDSWGNKPSDTFRAACAAVWLHGECANVFGPGLIAEDLPEVLPRVLQKLQRAVPGTGPPASPRLP